VHVSLACAVRVVGVKASLADQRSLTFPTVYVLLQWITCFSLPSLSPSFSSLFLSSFLHLHYSAVSWATSRAHLWTYYFFKKLLLYNFFVHLFNEKKILYENNINFYAVFHYRVGTITILATGNVPQRPPRCALEWCGYFKLLLPRLLTTTIPESICRGGCAHTVDKCLYANLELLL
jgi:hypothetical protein